MGKNLVLALLLAVPVCSLGAQNAESVWSQKPFKLVFTDGTPLDIANTSLGGYFDASESSDYSGHSAPFLADLTGDGKRDLVVGSFSGRFRFYKNVGTDAIPKFNRNFTWLKAGDEIAQVRIYCCVASGPQLVDIDGDGVLDLSSGSYDPGAIYWFKGLGGGKLAGQFKDRQMLTDWTGVPVFAHLKDMEDMLGRAKSFMTNVAWADWNNDGRLDMIFGTFSGKLFVRLAQERSSPGYTALSSQPVFQSHQKEIKIDTSKAIPGYHAAPSIADWDGDGIWDILVGTDNGSVYFLKNTGRPGKPEFKTRERIIEPGEGVDQWLERGQSARRGMRSQIHVVDYNRDGKLDILLGDWSTSITPRTGLTVEATLKMKHAHSQIVELDRRAGYDHRNWRNVTEGYTEELLGEYTKLRKELSQYLEKRQIGDGSSDASSHGYVWVFLRK